MTTDEALPRVPWVDPREEEQVSTVARRLFPEVSAWSATLPADARGPAANLCLLWAAACPDAPLPLLGALSRWSLAVGGFDDRIDAIATAPSRDRHGVLAPDDLAALFDGYAGAAELDAPGAWRRGPLGEEGAPFRRLLDAIVSCCRDLRALPHAGHGYPLFARHQAAMFRGMATELAWQRALIARGELPSRADYLRTGTLTIGAPACVAALLCVIPTPAAQGPEVGLLVEAIALACGACVRLSNDLRSGAREMLEERKPNSVAIRMHGGFGEDAARARVLVELGRRGRRLAFLVDRLPAALRGWGAWVLRLERVTRALYRAQDYRDDARALPSRNPPGDLSWTTSSTS